MISSTKLILLSMKSMDEYYAQIAEQFIGGKTYLAREQFLALSAKQRKGYFTHLTESGKATSGDKVYDFFFEIY